MSKVVIIAMTNQGRSALERTALAVPDDKLNWKPLDNGRTVLDLLGDAAQAPTMGTGILRSATPYGPEHFSTLRAERAGWTREEALAHLERNTLEFLEELNKVSDEKLDEPLSLPMGGGMTMPLGAWALIAYRAFTSRMAQINYIQTLYGDFDRH